MKNDPNQNYNQWTDKILDIVNNHDHLKTKFVRGNNAPFMNRELQKGIYVRSRLRILSGKKHAQIKLQRSNRAYEKHEYGHQIVSTLQYIAVVGTSNQLFSRSL